MQWSILAMSMSFTWLHFILYFSICMDGSINSLGKLVIRHQITKYLTIVGTKVCLFTDVIL